MFTAFTNKQNSCQSSLHVKKADLKVVDMN